MRKSQNTQQFYVLSEAVDRFHPLPKHQKQKFTNGSYRGLGMILIIAIFLQEVDLRNTNLGLNNKNEVIKIDGDWCFAALRDPIVWENLPRDITPQLIESLPYPMGIHTYHWIGLVKNGLAQVDSDYINPTELTHAPYFRAEINQAILQLLLIPEEYLNAFISTFIEEDANSYFEFMQSRTQQLRESALQNESFREYLASEQALVDAEAHLQRLKSFETNEKLRMIQPSEHSKINTKIHTQLRELRNSVGCNNRIIPRDANQNRDKKHGYRWLPENLSFGFLSGFLGASLVTTSLILLQIIDILTLGFGAALTATATIGIIVLPALLMGGLGYLIEASCTKPVRNPKVDKDGNSPDLIYDFSKEIQDFEEALAGLRRANGEHNIYSHTPKPKNFSIPDEPNERLGNAIFDL